MAQALESPGPVIRRAAGLHHDPQRQAVVERTGKGRTTQPLAVDDPTAGIGTGEIEDILGKIDGDAHGRRSGRNVRGVGDSMQGGLLL